LLIGLSFLAITSCKKTELASQTATPLLTADANVAPTSAAQVYKYQTTIDLSDPRWREYNACTGEWINIIKGIWHIDFIVTVTKNGYSYVYHTNVSDYKLIDQTTGIEYIGSYAYNETFFSDYTGLPAETTQTLKILLTTPGGGNNGMYVVDAHTTLSANGEITVDFINWRAGCQ